MLQVVEMHRIASALDTRNHLFAVQRQGLRKGGQQRGRHEEELERRQETKLLGHGVDREEEVHLPESIQERCVCHWLL